MSNVYHRIVDSRGRVYLPQPVMAACNLEKGAPVCIEETEGRVCLTRSEYYDSSRDTPQQRKRIVTGAIRSMDAMDLAAVQTALATRMAQLNEDALDKEAASAE